jgi:hypothetical protein
MIQFLARSVAAGGSHYVPPGPASAIITGSRLATIGPLRWESLMDPLLKTLVLENFRSFRRETVRFENPTFLVGRNGSGKSGLVDAITYSPRQRPCPCSRPWSGGGPAQRPIPGRISTSERDISPELVLFRRRIRPGRALREFGAVDRGGTLLVPGRFPGESGAMHHPSGRPGTLVVRASGSGDPHQRRWAQPRARAGVPGAAHSGG